MDDAKAQRIEEAKRFAREFAAKGSCTDHIDVEVAAAGRSFANEIRQLFLSREFRKEITDLCQAARKEKG